MLSPKDTAPLSTTEETIEGQINDEKLDQIAKEEEVTPRKKFKARRITAPSPEQSEKEEDREPDCKKLKVSPIPTPEVSPKQLNVVIDFETFGQTQLKPRKGWAKCAQKTALKCQEMNSQMDQPCQLSYLNFVSRIPEIYCGQGCNFGSWDVMQKKGGIAQFGLDKVVCVSQYARNVLKSVEEDKVYVIYGINSAPKNPSHAQAVSSMIHARMCKSFYTAKIPIDEHFNRPKVFNKKGKLIDSQSMLDPEETFGILTKFNETGCWKEAILASVSKDKGLVPKE